MISLHEMIRAVVLLIVAGLILLIVASLTWLLLSWLVDFCDSPEPFHKVARIVLAVAAVLMVIGVLLSLAGITVFSP